MNISLKQCWGLLSKYLKPFWAKLTLLFLMLGASIILQLINPQIIRAFIDRATSKKSSQELLLFAGAFVLVAVLQQVTSVLANYLSQDTGWSATNVLRKDLIGHCLHLDMTFHKKYRQGELIERLDSDVNQTFSFFSSLSLNIINNFALMIGIIVLLFLENVFIGIGLILFSVIAITILWHLQAKNVASWGAEREVSADFFGFVGEHVSSLEDIRSSGATDNTMRTFHMLLKKWFPIRRRAVMMYYALWITTLGLFALANTMVFGAGGYLLTKGKITIGTVYLIFNYTELLRRPIEQLRSNLEEFQRATASIIRVSEILTVKSKIIESGKNIVYDEPLDIHVENLCFEYDEGVPVLNNISFKLPKGRKLGILGRTGSGKTTIARLLIQFYNPTSGDIFINDNKIQLISLKDLRSKIGYVTQDVQLFHATVRDNLTFFDKSVQDDLILKTIFDVGIGDWFKKLPDGLDTMLNSGGGLSAGEAQLLAFVRVFLKDPKLIILDEASSRIDPATEKLIENALNKLLENRTCIIIAHRLQTLERTDDILILEKGSIKEYGQRELLAKDEKSYFHNLLQIGIEEVLA